MQTRHPMFSKAKRRVPEMDFSGFIFTLGPEAERQGLRQGAEIFGSIPVRTHIQTGKGAMVEYLTVKAENVCLKPENMTLAMAAGLPTAGCMAFDLVHQLPLVAGMRVLINGGSGGVGSMVVQLAKAAVGASGTVIAIASGPHQLYVKKLGADEVSFPI